MIYSIEPGWNTEVKECPTCLKHLNRCLCDAKEEE